MNAGPAGRPRVATVLTARRWEADFVNLARASALVRVVGRVYEAEDVERLAGEIDVLVAGAETSWVTPARIRAWRRCGIRVLGIHPAGDEPARRLLHAGTVDETLADTTPAQQVLHVARALAVARPTPLRTGCLVPVVGARGAPGRSEVALALAWTLAERCRTLLVDLDHEAPSLSLRLGLSARPHLTDAADAVRHGGELPPSLLQRAGPLWVVVGPPRPEPSPGLMAEVIYAGRGSFEMVLLDVGPIPGDHRLLPRADQAVLVCDGSPSGIVRAARLADAWLGPPPLLVLNRARGGDTLRAVRRWVGLEPAAVIPYAPAVRDASRAAAEPPPLLLEALDPLRLRLEEYRATGRAVVTLP